LKFKDIFLIPNLITLTRFFSAIFLFLYFTPFDFSSFYLVVIIAIIGLSDSLDGIVARKFNMVSTLGIILDPFTDRVVFLLLIFWVNELMYSWVFYSILLREIFVIIGSLYVLKSQKTVTVSNKGKLGTVFLFILICLFSLNLSILNEFVFYYSIFTIIFYFYVAFEYLYNLIYKSE
jgi:cardiolipin synthase